MKASPVSPSSSHPLSRRGFTLVELLTVIAIIAVLMGLLLPAAQSVKNAAKNTQAKNDATNIVTAVKSYYTEYGRYPNVGAVGQEKFDVEGDNAKLMNILRGIDTTNNTRKIVFLEVADVKNPTSTESGPGIRPSNGAWVDPWGKPYQVFIDTTYDNQVANPYSGNAGSNPLRLGVFTLSLGKDGLGGTGDKNTGDAKDDQLSWQ